VKSHGETAAGALREKARWKRSDKGASLNIGTSQFQSPAVNFGDPARNRQSEASAALCARTRFVGSPKALEDVRLIFRAMPGPASLNATV